MGVIKYKNDEGVWEALAAANLPIGNGDGRQVGYASFYIAGDVNASALDLTNYVDSEDDIVACMFRTSQSSYYSILFAPWVNSNRGFYLDNATNFFGNSLLPLAITPNVTQITPYVKFDAGMLELSQTPNGATLYPAPGYRVILFYYV